MTDTQKMKLPKYDNIIAIDPDVIQEFFSIFCMK